MANEMLVAKLHCRKPVVTLSDNLEEHSKKNPHDRGLEDVLRAIQGACQAIGALIARNQLESEVMMTWPQKGVPQSPSPLCLSADAVMKTALGSTNKVRAWASLVDKEPELVEIKSRVSGIGGNSVGQQYVVVFDPLDTSFDVDPAVSTGSIFGIYAAKHHGEGAEREACGKTEGEAMLQAMRPGRELMAAGYCMYSSCTMLVLATAGGAVNVFTLDSARACESGTSSASYTNRDASCFLLTHPDQRMPATGNIYSIDEAMMPAWDSKLEEYVSDIKAGRVSGGTAYSNRCVGAIVPDFHRTLLYGGILGMPALHSKPMHFSRATSGTLSLACAAAPLAFVAECAGGRAWSPTSPEQKESHSQNGVQSAPSRKFPEPSGDILNMEPQKIAQGAHGFFGSRDDVSEVKRYLMRNLGSRGGEERHLK